MRGEATPHPTTNHGQQAGPPPSSFRPPISSFPRKPESRGAVEGCGKTTTHRLPVISVPRYEAGIQ